MTTTLFTSIANRCRNPALLALDAQWLWDKLYSGRYAVLKSGRREPVDRRKLPRQALIQRYIISLDWTSGLSNTRCLECNAEANCGARIDHKPDCSEYNVRRALRVGQRTHVIHCTYPTIEETIIAEDKEREAHA